MSAVVRVQVLATQTAGTGAGAVNGWGGDALVANIGGTTAITGSATLTHIGASAFTVAVSADNTLDGLAVDVTGAAAKTVVWSVRMSGIEG